MTDKINILQSDLVRRVAFQGELGAYSELAAARFGLPVPYPTFARVCAALLAHEVEFAVLPTENVIAGPVPEVQRLLATQPLVVVTSLWLPIEHCLLGLPDASLTTATHVMSHWQALRQCCRFLARHPHLRATTVYDTAGAARLVWQHARPNLLAIASHQAAHHYGLRVIAEGIADRPDNATHFVLCRAGC
jgi:prephenate dehydratase|uniref:prephenate dehydratase n=1 Tax=Chloracidobacterium thermophilum TaxID=458033 RepID=A8DJB7_9BACT|nr:prephenate dehydratase [Chloracidobacterium thermophilum]